MDRRAAFAIEHAAQIVGADFLEDIEAGSEVHVRPPLTMAGRQIDTGHRRIVAAGPAAQGDLQNHHRQHGASQRAQGGQADIGGEPAGQAQREQKQQAERGETTQQMGGDHLRPQLQGDRPHAEQGLADDQRQQPQRQLQRIAVATALLQGKQRQAENGQP